MEMNKLLRMLSLCMVVFMLAASLPLNVLAENGTGETVSSAEAILPGIPAEPVQAAELPETEVYALPVQEAAVEEEPEMDLFAAMDSGENSAPAPEPEITVEPDITAEPETTPEPEGTEDTGTEIEPEASEAVPETEPEETPEVTPDQESAVEPEVSEEPEMTLLPETTPEPEMTPEPEATELPGETDMAVLDAVYYMNTGEGADVSVYLPESALPVMEVEGLVQDADYGLTEDGIILNARWLDTLAAGEVLVCIHGADGILYVQPVNVMEQVRMAGETVYDIENLLVNGAAISSGNGDGWSYDAATGVLALMGEAFTLSGSGTVNKIDVDVAETVTLSDLTLTAVNYAAFTCDTFGTDQINLSLTGENTITCAGLTSASQLTVNGEGRLNCGDVSASDFTWNAGALNAKALSVTGDLTVNDGVVNVSGNGLIAVAANNMTIAADAKVFVKTASSSTSFIAVSIAQTLTNSGTLDIEILPGIANELYGIKTRSYDGTDDVLNLVNNQTHEGKKFYGAYASEGFTSRGDCSFVNNQPMEEVIGIFGTGSAARSAGVFNYDARTNAKVSVCFRGVSGGYFAASQEGGKVNISMDNVAGPAVEEFGKYSAAFYGSSVYLSGDVTITGKNASNVHGAYGTNNVSCSGKVDIRFEDCTGTVGGLTAYGAQALFDNGADCSVYIDGGETAYGLWGNIIDIQPGTAIDIEIKDVAGEVRGVYDRSGDQTSIYGSLKVDVFNNSGDCLGFYGNIDIGSTDADVYILAPSLSLDYFKCTDKVNQKEYYLKGFLLKYENGQMQIAEKYVALEVDGRIYAVYPGVLGASGEKWAFDESTNTLTLNGFSGQKMLISEGIDTLNVVFKGENDLGIFDSYAGKTVFSGEGSLNIDGAALDGLGGVFGEDMAFNGGTYAIKNCETGIWGADISVDDVNISAEGGSIGIRAEKVLAISDKAVLDIRSGYRGLVAEDGCILNGSALDSSASRIKIENGAVVESAVETVLSVDGWTFFKEALTQDHGGETWNWNAEKQQLILDGYEGTVSYNGGDLSIFVESKAVLNGLYAGSLTIDGTDRAEITVSSLETGKLTIDNGYLTFYDGDALKVNDFAMNGGGLITGDLEIKNAAEIKGGELVCDKISADSLIVSGGAAAVYADVSIEADTICISGGEMATVGTVKCRTYEQTGGEVRINVNAAVEGYTFEANIIADSVSVTGGRIEAVNLNAAGVVIDADAVVIGGKASVKMYCPGGLFNAEKVDVCANAGTGKEDTLNMESGKVLKFAQTADAALTLGSQTYTAYMLDNHNFGGAGWDWNADSQTLTLYNVEMDSISINRKATIHIEDGTVSIVKNGIVGKKGLTITGEGLLEGNIQNESGSLTIKNISIYGEISNKGSISLSSVRMYYGAITANGGSITISGSNICCFNIYTNKNLTVKSSMIEALAYADEVNVKDVYAGGAAKFTSSVLMGKNFKAKSISGDKYSAMFTWGDYGYTLKKNATLNKNWVFPERYYYIPSGKTLTVQKGKNVVFQGELSRKGKLSGSADIVSIPDSFAINGKTEVTSGTSITMEIAQASQAWMKQHMIWVSSDSSICTVDKNGKVTVSDNPLYVGQQITITAICPLAENLSADFTFTIAPGAYEVIPLREDKEIKSLELWLDPANKTAQLTSVIYPANASQEVTWKSTKTKVATVSADGKVTAKAAGTAYIYAVAKDGTLKESERIKVTVKKAPTSVKFTSSTATLAYDAEQNIGSSKQLNVKLSSGSASSITYKSSNTSVVEVDENGVITAKKKGTATITATTYNKKKATCKVTVKAAPDKIELSKHEYVMGIGDTYTFTSKIPSGTVATWTYSTSDAEKVSVDAASGKIKAEALGEAIITVTTFNGRTDTCKVKVVPAPDSVTAAEKLTLGKGESYTLKPVPVLEAEGETAATYTFKSSNSKVVSVDKNGKLKAKKTGKATITITTYNDKSVKCVVTVKKAPASIKLSHKKGTLAYDEILKLGTSYKLTARLSSGSASAVKFTSSNSNVVKVETDGMITAVGTGTAKIKATTFNKKSATCTVTVKAAPSQMIFAKDAYKVAIDDDITVKASAEFGTYTPTCTYISGDSFIAMVDADTGLVKPVTLGKTTIIAKAFNGAAGSVEIAVVDAPETLTLNAYKGTLKRGKKFTIVPTVSRTDGKDTAASYTFKSSRTSVCTVSSGGVITAKKKGTAVITVSTHNSLKATVRVTVK